MEYPQSTEHTFVEDLQKANAGLDTDYKVLKPQSVRLVQ